MKAEPWPHYCVHAIVQTAYFTISSQSHIENTGADVRCPFTEIVEPLNRYVGRNLSREQWQQVIWNYILDLWRISWQIDNSDLRLLVSPDQIVCALQNNHMNRKILLVITGDVVIAGGLTYIFTGGAS